MATKRCQLKAYALLERAKMRSKAMSDFFLKKREMLRKLQLEFSMAGFGLSALGWYESYNSSASFRRVEYVVGFIQPGVDNIREVYGDIKPIVLTSFDQLQVASDVFHWRMVELEASVAIANTHREAKYREILSLYKAMVCRSEVWHSQPDTIIRKKIGFSS